MLHLDIPCDEHNIFVFVFLQYGQMADCINSQVVNNLKTTIVRR